MLISATNGKTTTAAMAAGILVRAGVAARPQPRRREHGRRHRDDAARRGRARRSASPGGSACSRSTSCGWRTSRASCTHARSCSATCFATSSIATASSRRSPTAGASCSPRSDALAVLNADDPLIADLGRERANVLYFGVEDDSLALPGMAHAADAKHCRNCGAPYVFDAVYLGHLGHYHCPSCGRARPEPDVLATDVRLEGVRAARFTLTTAEGERRGPARPAGSLQRLQRARRRGPGERPGGAARRASSPAWRRPGPPSAAPRR